MNEETKTKMKQIALTGGEQATKLGVETTIKLIEAYVEDTENKIDDKALEFIKATLLPMLYEQIDKIDGVEGNLEIKG